MQTPTEAFQFLPGVLNSSSMVYVSPDLKERSAGFVRNSLVESIIPKLLLIIWLKMSNFVAPLISFLPSLSLFSFSSFLSTNTGNLYAPRDSFKTFSFFKHCGLSLQSFSAVLLPAPHPPPPVTDFHPVFLTLCWFVSAKLEAATLSNNRDLVGNKPNG